MRALTLIADRKLELAEAAAPPPPGAGEVQSASMPSASIISISGAFAAWPLPSASCRSWSASKQPAKSPRSAQGRHEFAVGDPVVMYGALTCGTCKACREGRDNLCENVAGIMGFHVDGFARDLVNMPERLVIKAPSGVAMRDAACAPIAFATVEHMLFDNAKLDAGRNHPRPCRRVGHRNSAAITMAKAIGCTVFTTVGDDAKAEKAKALGADHVINYRPTASSMWCASSPARRASTSCSSTSEPRRSTARCWRSSAAGASSPAGQHRAHPRPSI